MHEPGPMVLWKELELETEMGYLSMHSIFCWCYVKNGKLKEIDAAITCQCHTHMHRHSSGNREKRNTKHGKRLVLTLGFLAFLCWYKSTFPRAKGELLALKDIEILKAIAVILKLFMKTSFVVHLHAPSSMF
ncbi:hypothetical protein V6N12_025152 [Hibiscus sabdariffa]|uniref:Uncharacterized protein n=1 Tax=Hibiscus sabdariffa TaxID=183260 RepID=A0ABR2BMB3_9ROSI